MLYYVRIDVFQGIDINKTRASKGHNIFHYWYFLDKGFEFQPNVCNKCHDISIMFLNFSDIAILNIKVTDYCCIIS